MAGPSRSAVHSLGLQGRNPSPRLIFGDSQPLLLGPLPGHGPGHSLHVLLIRNILESMIENSFSN